METCALLGSRQRGWRAGLADGAVRRVHRTRTPAGRNLGTIEFTKSFPWQALLQPNYLPFTNAHRAVFTETSLSLSHLSAVRLVDVPADLVVAPRWLSLPLVLVLTVSAMIDGARRKRALVWLVMSLLFLSRSPSA